MTAGATAPVFISGGGMSVDFWYWAFFVWGVVCGVVAIQGLRG